MFKLGDIVGKQQEAEQVGHKDDPGVALERRVRTGEWDFAVFQQQKFDQQNVGESQNTGVQNGVTKAEENKRYREDHGHKPRQSRGTEHTPSDWSGLLVFRA